MTKRNLLVAGLVTLLVAACGSDGDTSTDGGDQAATETTEATADSPATTAADSPATTTGAPETTAAPEAPRNAGSATLTVGDATYEFDNYYCLAGPENTGNDRVSLSSGAMGTVDEVRVQLDASIQDPDEEGRMEGEGTIQSVSLNDIEDFENPSVALDAITGFLGEPAWTITYDGSTVTAEALFDDSTTDEIEEIPGTLQATCGG